MRAIRVDEYGGPEVLTAQDVDEPTPAPGQAVVRLEAIGVNLVDTKQRSGALKIPLPFTPGTEGAGRVVATGSDVAGLAPGDRVGFAGPPGAYAELLVADAARLVRIPDSVGTDAAASVLLQGMTAHYLVHSVFRFETGDVVVVHAAAGGVGLLLTQLATRQGLRVIGTTSNEEKAGRIVAAGAVDVAVRSRHSLPDVVGGWTDGRGARAVFDSIGKDTIDDSFASLARRGYLVAFGAASGPPDAVEIRRLQEGGSLFLTRPGLADYVATREELEWRAGDVLSMVADGSLDVHVHARYPLADAADAHRAIESGTTSGKLLLIP